MRVLKRHFWPVCQGTSLGAIGGTATLGIFAFRSLVRTFGKNYSMGAIVIEADDTKNLSLIATIAKQLGGSVKRLSAAQLEDLQLTLFIQREKTGKKASREDVFKVLDKK